jgi:hypothetical protein
METANTQIPPVFNSGIPPSSIPAPEFALIG